jgi:hypothetical protein
MCPFCVIPIVWVVEATVAVGVTYLTTKAIQNVCSGGGCSLSPTRVASVIVEGVAAPVVAGVKVMPITGPTGTKTLNKAADDETGPALGPAVPIGIVLGGLANGKSKGVKGG